MPAKRRTKGAGTIRQLPSGRHQAIFTHDGSAYRQTFDTKAAAAAWLKKQTDAVTDDSFTPPAKSPTAASKSPRFADYADSWMTVRDVKPRTVAEYRRHLDNHIVPAFGQRRLDTITVTDVRDWYATLLPNAPKARSHVYGVLHAILTTAWQDDLIPANPARIRGASATKRHSQTVLPTAEQVAVIASKMPSQKYRTMVLIAAWCGLRFGELTELCGRDVVVVDGVPTTIRVNRAVTRVNGVYIVGDPKSFAGNREVTIPPHIRADVLLHLTESKAGPNDLPFPGTRNGEHMAPSSLYKPFYPARKAAGLPTAALAWSEALRRDLDGGRRGHLAELQARLGHSTVSAAMKYQHAAMSRDELLAERLSAAAG